MNEKVNLLKNNNLKIYLLTIISFLVGTSQFIIAGVLDKIAESIGISVSLAGQLITVFAIASAIGTPIVIMLISKHNQRTQLLIALFIFLIGIFLTPLAFGFNFLILARVITGVGSSVFVVVAYTLASNLAKEGKQGSAMSNIALGFSLSLVLGIPLGRTITFMYDWHMIFWLIGILVFLGSIVIYFVIPTFKGQEPMPLKKQFLLFKDLKVTLTLGVTLFVFISFSIISTYITPFIFSIEKVSEHQIAIIFLIFGIASVIGSKLGASLADRIGVLPVLLGTILVIILSLGTTFIFMDSLEFVVGMLSIWTIALWMFGPTQSLNISRLIPNTSSILLSLNGSVVQLGFAIGAGLGGIIISAFSIKSIIWIAILCGITALVIYFIFLVNIRNKKFNVNIK